MQLCERRTTNGLLQVSWFLCWLESTLLTIFLNGKQGPIQQPNATHVRSQSSIGLQSLIVRLTKSTLGSSLDLDDVVCVGSFYLRISFLVLGLLNRGMITTSANSMYRAQWNANTHILPGDTRYQGEAGKRETSHCTLCPPKRHLFISSRSLRGTARQGVGDPWEERWASAVAAAGGVGFWRWLGPLSWAVPWRSNG